MKKEKSCGCIIIDDERRVLLIRHTKGHWGFPKGHVEMDEAEEQTAIREVKEETNIDVKIEGEKRYSEEYLTDSGIQKEVVYFIATKIGGDIKRQESEVSEIEWMDFDDALDTITYDNTRELFERILKENKLK